MPAQPDQSVTLSTRNEIRTSAPHSSRLSPRRPTETTSSALMLRRVRLASLRRTFHSVVGTGGRPSDHFDDLHNTHDFSLARSPWSSFAHKQDVMIRSRRHGRQRSAKMRSTAACSRSSARRPGFRRPAPASGHVCASGGVVAKHAKGCGCGRSRHGESGLFGGEPLAPTLQNAPADPVTQCDADGGP